MEEIDFLKRNLVNLAHMQVARSKCNAFLVNDAIYVFGGSGDASAQDMKGEIYTLSVNKWREIAPKVNLSMGGGSGVKETGGGPAIVKGPAALLYE